MPASRSSPAAVRASWKRPTKARTRGRSPAVGLNILLPHEQGGNGSRTCRINFRYFFARKMMFVRFASAYVVLPGGFGTLDELSECLTLVQTGKSRKIPIILVGARILARAASTGWATGWSAKR